MWSLIGKVKKASKKTDTYGQVYRQADKDAVMANLHCQPDLIWKPTSGKVYDVISRKVELREEPC